MLAPVHLRAQSIGQNRQVLIRLAATDDLAALVELAARTFPLACPPQMPAEDMTAFVAQHLAAKNFEAFFADETAEILVAESAGKLAGYTLTFDREPYDAHIGELVKNRPTVELSKCYADPSAHGTGITGQLMAEVLGRAKSRGAKSVWLGVNGMNERAQRFYAKHGFKVIGDRKFIVGDQTEDDLVFEHEL